MFNSQEITKRNPSKRFTIDSEKPEFQLAICYRISQKHKK